ncbi:MAG: hypothetical protein AMXMBFR13_48890 [Phycisphaerae bacterium]
MARGLTLVEVLIVFLLVVFTIWILLPSMTSRGPSWRTTCAANLNGMGKGFYTYGSENGGWWPIAAHLRPDKDEVGNVIYAPGQIGQNRTGETKGTDTQLSVTRNLWTLVRTGGATPASFICPESDDSKNNADNPQDYWDFVGYSEVSYGYQVPYGKLGQPNSDCDSRMALAADKGPYGAALEAGKRHPGQPPRQWRDSPDDWTRWNSPNHDGEGQNVLIADSHVEFFNKPAIGVEHDNLYTRWSDATGGVGGDEGIRVNGTPPTGNETPWSDTDSLIYP